MLLRRLVAFLFVCTLTIPVLHLAAAAPDIVLRSADFKNVHGNWSIADDPTAADGKFIGSADYGWSAATEPPSQPTDYFEATFDAPAGTPYHVWVRLRASANSKYNDSIWVQVLGRRHGRWHRGVPHRHDQRAEREPRTVQWVRAVRVGLAG